MLPTEYLKIQPTLRQPMDARLPWRVQTYKQLAGGALVEYNGVAAGTVVSAGLLVTALTLTAEGQPTVVFDDFPAGFILEHIHACFDLNGYLTVTYSGAPAGQTSMCYLYYYDSVMQAYNTIMAPIGSRTPCCSFDWPWQGQADERDIVWSYIREVAGEHWLCIRYQRERYLYELVITDGLRARDMLRTAGASVQGRYCWRFYDKVTGANL